MFWFFAAGVRPSDSGCRMRCLTVSNYDENFFFPSGGFILFSTGGMYLLISSSRPLYLLMYSWSMKPSTSFVLSAFSRQNLSKLMPPLLS